jgi:thiamine transport system permease protein
MLADQDLVTIPIVMYRLISSYKFYAACALGTVLMLLTGLVFLLIDRLGGEQQ